MLNTPDPEQANGETAVTITDLDAPQTGHVPGSATRRDHAPVLPARLWMRIALLGGTVLLVLLLLAQGPHPYEPAAMGGGTLPAAPYLSLSSTDGIAYASSPDGTVWAMRVRDGFLLWHHAGREAVEALTTIADGVLFLALRAFENGASAMIVEALRASDGLVLWSYRPHVPTTPWSPLVVDGLVLITLQDGSMEALHASNGALLWHRTLDRS